MTGNVTGRFGIHVIRACARAREAAPETVQVTDDLIREGMSDAGGWTREQITLLGEQWPAVTGWRKRACCRRIPAGDARRFLELKNSSKAMRRSAAIKGAPRSSAVQDGRIYRTPCHPSKAVDCPFEPNVTQSLYDRSDRIRKLADKSK